jgi:glycosyltransferase involved in cell wall biosynthesis
VKQPKLAQDIGKRILIVEKRVPTPDRDSGSVRLQQIMELLKQLGCTVDFIPDDMRWVEGYSSQLQEAGIKVWHFPEVRTIHELMESRGQCYDYIMLCRYAVAGRHIDTVRRYAPQATIVFDTVDLHYLREERRAELENTDARRRIAAETKGEELDVLRKADVTLVVSPEERDELARVAPDAKVEILSNIQRLPEERLPPFAGRQGLLFVGGFKHHPNVDAVEWFVREVWPLIRIKIPEATVEVVGSYMPDRIRKLASSAVRMRGFVDDLSPFLRAARISIAPLRYGAGVKGKVNQAMAWGIPVVATPVAAEGLGVRRGEHMLVEQDADAFANAVVRLYRDKALWNELSDRGRKSVAQRFSRGVANKSLKSILGIAGTHDASTSMAAGEGVQHDRPSPGEAEEDIRDFRGKTVLAIGQSVTGLAESAVALDPTKLSVWDIDDDGFGRISQAVNDIRTELFLIREAWPGLDPTMYSADTTLASWGGSARGNDAFNIFITEVAAVTNETLYLQVPRAECDQPKEKPSLHGQAVIFETLGRFFTEVSIVAANRQSGCGLNANGQLIRATGLRPQWPILAAINSAKPLDIALAPATNTAALVQSSDQLLVIKTMGPRSRLAKLDGALLTRLCDELNALKPKWVVAPLKIGEHYRITHREDNFMVFPFVKKFSEERDSRNQIAFEEMDTAFMQVRRDLRKVSSGLINDLKKAKFVVPTKRSRARLKGQGFIANHLKGLEGSFEELLALAETAGDEDFDAVIHGDLQIVNLIVDDQDEVRCVDLDNMALATAYTDILMAWAWQGASADRFGDICVRIAREEVRPITQMDIAVAVSLLLSWRLAVEKFSHVAGVEQTVNRWERGIRNLVRWAE